MKQKGWLDASPVNKKLAKMGRTTDLSKMDRQVAC